MGHFVGSLYVLGYGLNMEPFVGHHFGGDSCPPLLSCPCHYDLPYEAATEWGSSMGEEEGIGPPGPPLPNSTFKGVGMRPGQNDRLYAGVRAYRGNSSPSSHCRATPKARNKEIVGNQVGNTVQRALMAHWKLLGFSVRRSQNHHV